MASWAKLSVSLNTSIQKYSANFLRSTSFDLLSNTFSCDWSLEQKYGMITEPRHLTEKDNNGVPICLLMSVYA